LAAQITTNRGCFETGNNPVYTVGETVSVFYRVDGQSGGQTIPQAQIAIFDVPPGGSPELIFSGTQPTGQTFGFSGTASPPPGVESLIIQAQAAGLTAQDQCSFQIVQAAVCMTACDCPTGQLCNEDGQCEVGVTPVYCCSHGPCPSLATCQEIGGAYAQCPS
jgi:hypothetical protein